MRKYKYLFLTLMLITGLILDSLARQTAREPVAADLLLTILAMAVFAVVFQRRWERIVAFFTAAASIAITWSHLLALQNFDRIQKQERGLTRPIGPHGRCSALRARCVSAALPAS